MPGESARFINLNSLSNDIGISNTTLSGWLSLLEASFIIFKLYPYFENFGKRIIKSPKIYFSEIGLATYLLGIENAKQVTRDPLIGNLFENLVVIEAIKARLNKGLDPNLYFYRDNNRNEVDLIYKKSRELIPIEIKSSKTLNPDFYKGISFFKKISSTTQKGYLLYAGDLTPDLPNVAIKNYINTYEIFE